MCHVADGGGTFVGGAFAAGDIAASLKQMCSCSKHRPSFDSLISVPLIHSHGAGLRAHGSCLLARFRFPILFAVIIFAPQQMHRESGQWMQ